MKIPPQRVLHVIDSLDLGGAQTVLLNLATAQDRDAFPFAVAAMHGRGVFAEALEAQGIRVHSLSPHKLCPAYFWQLPDLLRRERFDILHCHLFGANWIGKPLGRLQSVPLIVAHDHCNDRFRSQRPLPLWIDALTNRLADGIIGVSRSTCDFLLEAEGLPAEKVRLIYNGIDTASFRPATSEKRAQARVHFGLDPQLPVVGGAGRFTPQKNFGRWLRVLADTARRGVPFQALLCGAGPEESHLRAEIQRLGLTDKIRWAGFVADRELLYAALDVLLVTSDYEGLPMNVLEALASGVPVVASHVDGLAEILYPGRHALLPHPEKEWEYPHALEKVLTDQNTRETLVREGRRLMVDKFSAQHMAEAVTDFYRALLQEKEAGRSC